MSYELIITEKPSAAQKIASALASGKPIKESEKGAPYYKITHGNKDIVVGCAVGHLYTLAEKNKGKWTYPVFDVEWKATSAVRKDAKYAAKYVSLLKKLAKDANEFTVATDFDIEGEVIGLNVVRYICKQKDAKRMKFSTLTKDELINSYEKAAKHIEWGQANAGLTRHELDYYYGINLSRALSLSIKAVGSFKVLSSGRVQGPALKIIVDKEKLIQAFKPVPYWQLELHGKAKEKNINALHKEDKFWEKEKAEKIHEKVKGKKAVVDKINKRQFKQAPPHPFDLTTLQTEAYRSLRIQPKDTLVLAQELYLKGLISYPRTSSQVLPKEIGYQKILKQLAKQQYYQKLANSLLTKKELKPNNGKKTDPAHPAIFPTGQISEIDGREAKIYDIIVRRFLATFGEPATRETVQIEIDVEKEIFITKGTRTVEKGWFEFYGKHVKLEEEELPAVEKGDEIKVKKILLLDKETQPPKRYTPASIIKELEKRGLGTKATRSAIVDALYKRGYVDEKSIQATNLGIKICETLEKYCPRILDEKLTRHFEEEMEKIRKSKKKPKDVLEEAKEILIKILKNFKKKEMEIGKELSSAYKETRAEKEYLGPCPNCKEGKLTLRKGKFGRFAACDQYPKCKTTFSLPAAGIIKSLKKDCDECGFPLLKISTKKKKQDVCLNPKCPTKKIEEAEAKKLEKPCPKCDGRLVVRKSVYGSFLGCTNYPKCKYSEPIESTEEKKEIKEREVEE